MNKGARRSRFDVRALPAVSYRLTDKICLRHSANYDNSALVTQRFSVLKFRGIPFSVF